MLSADATRPSTVDVRVAGVPDSVLFRKCGDSEPPDKRCNKQALAGSFLWNLSLSYRTSETIFFGIYPDSGSNVIYVP